MSPSLGSDGSLRQRPAHVHLDARHRVVDKIALGDEAMAFVEAALGDPGVAPHEVATLLLDMHQDRSEYGRREASPRNAGSSGRRPPFKDSVSKVIGFDSPDRDHHQPIVTERPRATRRSLDVHRNDSR